MYKKLLATQQRLARSRRLFQFVTYAAAALFVTLLAFSGWKNRAAVLPFFRQADYSQIVGFVAFYLVSVVAATVGWVSIMRTFDRSLGGWIHIQIYNLTLATRRLPGTLWYIGGRIYIYQQLGLTKTVIVMANAIELLILMVTAGILGLSLLLLNRVSFSATTIIIVFVGILAAAIILRPAVFRWILQKFGAPPAANLAFHSILIWVFFYSCMWIATGLMVNQLVSVFRPGGINQAVYVIGAYALSTMAGMATFFLPSNFGVTELALIALLSPLLPLPLAGVVAILVRFLSTVLEIGDSVVFYLIALRSPDLAVILRTRQEPGQPG
jgi:glycosyltransferase 2 family protein